MPASEPSSYRPISNLSIISKLLERLLARQLISFLEGNNLLPLNQSGFRCGHSTESAITKLLSDLLDAIDNADTAILALLDLTAAFDSVDHDILLERLRISFGMSDLALNWFRSYLSGRTRVVRCGGISSSSVDLACGVPQGSVLGPLLFIIYTADLPSVVTLHGFNVHMYADDSQIYGSCHPTETSRLSSALTSCTDSVAGWMRSNRLQQNAHKTDVLWCASARRAACLPTDPICIAGSDVQPSSTVRDLGVWLDSELGAASHVRLLVSRCFSALRQLRQIRRYVSGR